MDLVSDQEPRGINSINHLLHIWQIVSIFESEVEHKSNTTAWERRQVWQIPPQHSAKWEASSGILDNNWQYLTILDNTKWEGSSGYTFPRPYALPRTICAPTCRPPLPSVSCHELPPSSFFYSSSSLTSCFCLLLLCLSPKGGPRYVNTWQRKGESNQMRWSLPAILDITDNTWQYLMTILDMTILDNTWKYLERKGVDNERAFRWGDQTDQISAGDLPRRVIV